LGGSPLAARQDLWCALCDLSLELIEFLLDDLLVVRKVSFEPLESTGVILGFEVFLELIELLVRHLVG
jgi:hypothetical protein